MITRETLERKLRAVQNQEQAAQRQLLACAGARQILQELLGECARESPVVTENGAEAPRIEYQHEQEAMGITP